MHIPPPRQDFKATRAPAFDALNGLAFFACPTVPPGVLPPRPTSTPGVSVPRSQEPETMYNEQVKRRSLASLSYGLLLSPVVWFVALKAAAQADAPSGLAGSFQRALEG